MAEQNYDQVISRLKKKIKDQWVEFEKKSCTGKIFTNQERMDDFLQYMDDGREALLELDEGNDRAEFNELSAFAKGANIANIDACWLEYQFPREKYIPKNIPMLSEINEDDMIDYILGLARQYRKIFFEKMRIQQNIRSRLHEIVSDYINLLNAEGIF